MTAAPTDRSALEEAIRVMTPWWTTGLMPSAIGLSRFTAADLKRIQLVCDAAAAHVETMPKTKMVEVWRVEYASNGIPLTATFLTWEAAEDWVGGAAGLPYIACANVTGPHQQEIPA